MKMWRVLAVAAVLVGAVPGAWAGAKDAGGATGIKLGRGRLHLGVSANVGVDTNPNVGPYELLLSRQDGGETASFINGGPTYNIPKGAPHPNKVLFRYPPDIFFALRPSASINLPGDRFSLSANLQLNYYEYLGVLNPGLPFMPGTDAYVQQLRPIDYNSGYRRLRTLDGSIGGNLAINQKKGNFGLGLTGGPQRSVDPGPIAVGSRLSRTNFGAGLILMFRPGGGTMEFSGRTGVNAEIYDPQNGRDFNGEPIPDFTAWDRFPNNLLGRGNPVDVLGIAPAANATVDPSQFHNAGLSVGARWQWRFLPKSAVFVEGGVGSRFYLKFYDNPNAHQVPISLLGGLIGQITSKFGVVASAGLNYPLSLCFDPGPDFTFDRFNTSARCAANTGVLNGQPADGSQGQSDADYILGLAGLPAVSPYMWWSPDLLRWQPLVAAPVGQLEGRLQLTPTLVFALGIRRAMKLVPLYRFASDNRIYASMRGTFLQRLQVTLSATNSFSPYGQLADRSAAYNAFPFDDLVRDNIAFLADADPGRWDNDLQLMAGLDVFATKWLIFGLTNTLTWHYTNAETGRTGDRPGLYNEPPYNLSFLRNVTIARVELRY